MYVSYFYVVQNTRRLPGLAIIAYIFSQQSLHKIENAMIKWKSDFCTYPTN